jgi:hypothetical protein
MTNRTYWLALPALIAGCAIDSTDASDGADGSDGEDLATSSVDQAVTTKCAVGHASNAQLSVFSALESYKRTGDPAINYDCDCLAWQKEVNNSNETTADAMYPKCRASTWVDISWQVWGYNHAWEVSVPSWTLTNGDTECNNSILEVEVWDEIAPNTFQFQYQTSWQPHVMPDGTCSPIGITGGENLGRNRRIKATATRGLFTKNHGFETVKISGYTY